MTTWYDDDSLLEIMAADTYFTFTEGHIRMLIYMCEQQQEIIQEACDAMLKIDKQPPDALLNAREGVIDLKAWGHRLLECIDEEDLDDELIIDSDTDDDSNPITQDDIESFRQALQTGRPLHRNSAKRTGGNLLQKLRRWYLSL